LFMASPSILLLSSDEGVADVVRRVAAALGARLSVVSARFDAFLPAFDGCGYDAILAHADPPAALVMRVRNVAAPGTGCAPVIALCREGSIPDAVGAIQAGACDYLAIIGPGAEGALQRAVRSALDAAGRAEPTRQAPGLLAGAFTSGDSRTLGICDTLEKVSASDFSVLIEGECGAGKTHLARALHERSHRARGAFVEVLCRATPQAVLAADLFGDPSSGRAGALWAARDGTVLLSDVSAFPPPLQNELLRRLAGARTGQAACPRLLAADCADLEQRVRAGQFHPRLWRLLCKVRVQIPPLRERLLDIPVLARLFLREAAMAHGVAPCGIALAAMDALVRYVWPGNVLELKNVMQQAAVLAGGRRVELRHLPDRVREAARAGPMPRWLPAPKPLRVAMQEPERLYILKALEASGWNKQEAARRLRICRSTLYKKMRRHGLDSSGQRAGAAYGDV